MTSHSLINFLLTRSDAKADEILQAMQAGDLNIDAAVAANPNIVVEFIARQAQQRPNYTSLPPLATRTAQCKLLEHMLKLGASPWVEDAKNTLQGIEGAISTGNPDLVRMVAAHPDSPHNLFEKMIDRARSGYLFRQKTPEMVQAFFGLGMDPNSQDQEGNTLLHEVQTPEVARFLLESGVDPSAVNKHGHDASKCWDQRNDLTVAQRRALDEVLALHATVDRDSFIKNLGEQWMEVGSTVCKARIKSTLDMDPAAITHQGFTLPEIVLAHMLSHSLKRDGSQVAHRKLRRTLLSVMNYCSITKPSDVVPGSGLHTALGMFRAADLGLGKTSGPAAPPPRMYGATARKKTSPPADNTGQDINDLLHIQPGKGLQVSPELAISWIEQAAAAGLLKNPAKAVLWQLKFGKGLEWNSPLPAKDAILARALVCVANSQMNEEWQGYFGYSPVTRSVMEICSTWANPIHVDSLVSQPQALPAIGLLLAGAGRMPPSVAHDSAMNALRQAIATRIADVSTPIDPTDPMVLQAVKDLKASDVEANKDLGLQLDARVQAQIMHSNTATAPTAKTGPRF